VLLILRGKAERVKQDVVLPCSFLSFLKPRPFRGEQTSRRLLEGGWLSRAAFDHSFDRVVDRFYIIFAENKIRSFVPQAE
jgi:hypothetical protein